MRGVTKRTLVAVALVTTATACSPSLNWRTVSLQGLDVLLPCKPDHGERKVQLGVQAVLLRMSGCEASGALYAVSHLRVAEAAQVESTRIAWRKATLLAMQAAGDVTPSATAIDAPTTLSGVLPQPEQLDGKRPDGSPVKAQFVWLSKGQDIYQVAVYASQLDKEKTELLFSELRLQ